MKNIMTHTLLCLLIFFSFHTSFAKHPKTQKNVLSMVCDTKDDGKIWIKLNQKNLLLTLGWRTSSVVIWKHKIFLFHSYYKDSDVYVILDAASKERQSQFNVSLDRKTVTYRTYDKTYRTLGLKYKENIHSCVEAQFSFKNNK